MHYKKKHNHDYSEGMESTRTLTVCSASAGSGKTFTLAARYVGLLLDGASYRSILAVTFTNKATAEMKERILLYLYGIAHALPSAESAFMAAKDAMRHASHTADAALRQRAGEVLMQILADYDNMHVTTIDTFMQQLLTGLIRMLGEAQATGVELDTGAVTAKAVDSLLQGKEDIATDYITRLRQYAGQRLDDEKNWDLRADLVATMKELFQESAQVLDLEGKLPLDPALLDAYREEVRWQKHPDIAALRRLMEQLSDWDPETEMETHAKPYRKLLDETALSLANPLGMDKKLRFRGLTDAEQRKFDEGEAAFAAFFKDGARGQALYSKVARLLELHKRCRKVLFTWQCSTSRLNDLALAADVKKAVRRQLADESRLLLAETANRLSKAADCVDFILEKAGIRYQHIMIDEFQDTSTLQWRNLRPLLEELLSRITGSALIVGDMKQSIYRWRNGDWRIMSSLPADKVLSRYYTPLDKARNWRSAREIVRFNLQLFRRLTADAPAGIKEKVAAIYSHEFDPAAPQPDIAGYYNPANAGGFVSFTALPCRAARQAGAALPLMAEAEETAAEDMFLRIEELLAGGDRPADMMILIRTNKEADRLTACFRRLAESGEHPALAATRLVSGDSFLLRSSASVQTVMHALRYMVKGDDVSAKYVSLACSEDTLLRLRRLNPDLPLYELLQQTVRLCIPGRATDLAYINCLMDCAIDFIGKEGASASAFLAYWDERLQQKAVPTADTTGIQLLTIHKAKGLEAKSVFLPACHWELLKEKGVVWCRDAAAAHDFCLPVSFSSDMRESAYEAGYEEERCMQYVDNLNLLYVALTRAAKRLYVYACLPCTAGEIPKQNNVGALMLNALGLQEEFRQKVENPGQDDSGPLRITWTTGETTLPETEQRKAEPGVFSFDGAPAVPAALVQNDGQVEFRQTQQAVDYLLLGEERAAQKTAQLSFGTVCHDIMAAMTTREDEEQALVQAVGRGLLASGEEELQARRFIDRAWSNPLMCDWFSGNWQLLRETTLLQADAPELRPDRVMLRHDSAIVLDYKFGRLRSTRYEEQVRTYMDAVRRMGYTAVKGYLWYANYGELVEVVS
ncbi:MAG: UvrD-helicase domain-containing protein [Paludibacteraceae bacterium]|nr:UvrD-helicase domain-containing protein [Paludibacteraceae bacterium]